MQKHIFILVMICFLTACQGTWSDYPEPSEQAAVNSLIATIAPGDVIHVAIMDEDTLSGDYAVLPNGMIAMPVMGDIEVGGKTTGEAALAVKEAFQDGDYLINPHVTVKIIPNHMITVIGEVMNQGEYEWRQGGTVLGVVGRSGGFTYRANQRSFDIIRRNGRGFEEQIDGQLSTRIMAGDIVRVRERMF